MGDNFGMTSSRPILRIVAVIQGALVWSMRVVCVLSGVAMAVTVFLGVFYRYALGDSLAYATGLPTVLFPYFIMSGAVLAAAKGEHLDVDFVLVRMPRALRRWLPLATKLLVIIVFSFVSFVGIGLLPTLALRTVPLLGWPASWAFYSVPIGFGILAIYTATDAVVALLGNEIESRTDNEG